VAESAEPLLKRCRRFCRYTEGTLSAGFPRVSGIRLLCRFYAKQDRSNSQRRVKTPRRPAAFESASTRNRAMWGIPRT